MELEIISDSPERTQAIGRAVGASARPGDVVLLFGELGSGKTCFTQGVLWGLGVDDFARSPTFVLVTEYQGCLPLYHVDLYRIDGEHEVDDLGLDEYLFGDGVCVVEWAERACGSYPDYRVEIRFRHLGDTTRGLTLTAPCGVLDAALLAAESAAAGS